MSSANALVLSLFFMVTLFFLMNEILAIICHQSGALIFKTLAVLAYCRNQPISDVHQSCYDLHPSIFFCHMGFLFFPVFHLFPIMIFFF